MASFVSRDQIENTLGMSVTEMDHNELVNYFKNQQRRINGFRMSMVLADFVIAEKFLIDQYGQPSAGRIVKWLFYRYKGKITIKGETDLATLRSFNAKNKWWVDQLDFEQQKAVAEELKPKTYVSPDF